MVYDNYSDYIGTFINSDAEWTFKSNPRYFYMLEHVNNDQGNQCLVEIKKRFSDLYLSNKQFFIDLCTKNDSIGHPIKYHIDDFLNCSPTNVRYILHSLLILTHMKSLNLNNIDIIEIGGGYGGLCFYLFNISKLFNITISSYSIFDLKNPLLLQKKYLDKIGINTNICNFCDIESFNNIKKNSFFVSTYAYSEISPNIQKIYTEKVLNPYVSHGFIAWNCIDVYKFIENKDLDIEDEYPLTGTGNKFVRF